MLVKLFKESKIALPFFGSANPTRPKQQTKKKTFITEGYACTDFIEGFISKNLKG